MHERTAILLAEVIADGTFSERAVRKRIAQTFGSRRTSLWPKRLFEFARTTAVDADGQLNRMALAKQLMNAEQITGILDRTLRRIDDAAAQIKPQNRPASGMFPVSERAASWGVPVITTSGQLAEFLSVTCNELDWFADVAGIESRQRTEKLRHYRYRWVSKTSGGKRLLESPKPRLKRIQSTILSQVLDRIPTHTAAHGFVKKRSCRTAAAYHVGQQVVLKIDLRQFFPSVSSGRIIAIFRSAGYPQRIAQILTGLCTNTTWSSVLEQQSLPTGMTHRLHDATTRHFLVPHLPQGSPTSPTLANLAAFRLDQRLSGLAKAFNATYTRYADDLVFSGGKDLSDGIKRARIWICAICLNEGFQIQQRKTAVLRKHQQQAVHGIVVNKAPAISRKQRDELKAILHNCVRIGPAANNRNRVPDFQAHLQGRIAAIAAVNAAHAEKLKTLFEHIDWTSPANR